MPEISPQINRRYSHLLQKVTLARYFKALKLVMAADGISGCEMKAFERGLTSLGVDSATRKEIDDYVPADKNILRILPEFQLGSLEARYLVRDAIELASADGHYAKAERAMVAKVASLLGVEKEVLAALEALVELEHSAANLRRGLLH